MSAYTHKQGQYLAFIYHYTKINGLPPAESDMQRYFRTSPPTVHSMVVRSGAARVYPQSARSGAIDPRGVTS